MEIPKTSFTGDFTMLQMNNPNMWTQSMGGETGSINSSKRLQEQDNQLSVQNSQDTSYLSPDERTEIQAMLNGTSDRSNQSQAYGSTVLDGMNVKYNKNYAMTELNRGAFDGSMASQIQVQPRANTDMATTPAMLPADLTTEDRMNSSPAQETGSMTNPNTLGESLGKLIEGVHDKTIEYETQSNALINKGKGSPYEQTKDSMFSDYQELSGIQKKDNQKSDIERQIEGFVEVMNGSYEYYIYSSLLVDSGKSISQTAQTLTKG